jgi:hypothetical protein
MDPPLPTGSLRQVVREMPAQHCVDLAASYPFRKSYGVRVGINDVPDRDAPLSF